jgi:ABC-type transport system substrate-binding protein
MGPGPRLSLLALGAGLALLVSAASSTWAKPSAAFANPHGESEGGGTLRLMWGIDPGSLDSALAGQPGSGILKDATCAKLVRTVYDPNTGKVPVVPEVAVDYPKITNGGRTYTFELKRTFRFDTGERVTARSFADAFHRNANPKLGSPARDYMQEIIGADAAMQGTAKTISGVQPLGRYRLRIGLKRPAGDFVARLTMPYFCPIPLGTPVAREVKYPDGSGPYYVDERVPTRRIVLQRNPYYPRGVRDATPDRIVWTIESDIPEKVRATEQGENDFTPLFAWSDAVIRELVDKYDVSRPGARVLRDSSTLANFRFTFNLKRRAFKGAGQAPLRKAINYALDRPALTRAHGHLAARRSDRLLPAALRESRRFYPLGGPDPDTARRWLARAGYKPQTLTLYTATYSWSQLGAQVFVSNLRQLDIKVKVETFALPQLIEKVNTRGEEWDVAWFPTGTYPDPAGAFGRVLRGTKYEARVNAANRLADPAARAKAWADLEADVMLNDPPVAVYADFTPLAFVSLRNFGCWTGADAYLDLAAVCKK